MFMVVADLPNTPQQVVERDVSMFLTSSKEKIPKDFPIKILPRILRPIFTSFSTVYGTYGHVAFYSNLNELLKNELTVLTVIKNPQKYKDVKEFTQYIEYNDKFISVSNDYQYEMIDDVLYTRHTHKHFYVYTNEDTQYMIVR